MAKKTEDKPSREDDRSVSAIKPAAFDKLVARLAAENRSLKTGRDKKRDLMADAVEDGLHKGAFAVFMKLRDMDPVKRNEWLFHFEVYCDRGSFTREELFVRTEDGGSEVPDRTEGSDDERDMRPRSLRQPGASAVQALAESAGATVHPIDEVGRGKPKGDDKPKLN